MAPSNCPDYTQNITDKPSPALNKSKDEVFFQRLHATKPERRSSAENRHRGEISDFIGAKRKGGQCEPADRSGAALGRIRYEENAWVTSDIAGYEPETDRRYRPAGLVGESEDIERLECASRWLGLTEPEAEILFDLNGPPYTPSNITQEHLLAVLEAICKGEPVERDIWVRNDPGRDR